MPTMAREIHLLAYPAGEPQPGDFTLVERPLPEPRHGELLIRNQAISVDPYMRGKMTGKRTYTAPYELNAPMEGRAVGVVEVSRDPDFTEGTVVLHDAGWRDRAVVGSGHVRAINVIDAIPVTAHLGVLGMPGRTAYVGLFEKARMRGGESVFVSGAAGAVGGLVGQLARLRGASRVIGSAGSAEKVDYLVNELGFDAAFNYKDGPVVEQLSQLAPHGIDIYFDNVGGDHLEAAMAVANPFARFALCGAISGYNATEPQPGPRNMALIVTKRLMLQGFIVTDTSDATADFYREVAPAVADGRLKFRETVVEGLENAPEAFISMLRGANTGKMVVRVGT
ncbi:NADP-dependent oxidoreductase [Salinactinospora qingdaonensis]|uniref:NADP-dependent oxidoreductase n=1 Tax=Salinactinospora qingdaonensis TaxID=702744 RepID=A0ABP7F1U3_9ACTN